MHRPPEWSGLTGVQIKTCCCVPAADCFLFLPFLRTSDMKLLFLAAFSIFFPAVLLHAQTEALFFPRNLQATYEKGVRSRDGKPGPRYWQNRSEYVIQVALDPRKRTISGSEEVTYFNNSPDSLRYIRLNLLHDLYKKGGRRSESVSPADITDGVWIGKVLINGVPVPPKKQRRHGTWLDVTPARALAAGQSLRLSVEWRYTMPSDPNATRECVCDPSTFFVSYFYPEIAVYDDLHGWADVPYNGLQEFYHDFSNYDVTITAPKGYMVWATGEWQNAEALLQPTYLDRWNRAHSAADVVPVFTEAELKSGSVFKKQKQHVFHYKAGEVPDFAFAASDHYHWDATSTVADDKTGRRTFVSAAYNAKSKDFYRVARIAADGVRLMSTWLPGYPFPYPCLTVFNGNDGMEYPMMVNDESVGEGEVAELTIHESAHTYFPFMMGTNEQYYAWMDEGWANFFHFYVTDSLEHRKSRVWAGGFGHDWETPPMVLSAFLSDRAYSHASYTRPQMAYMQLYELLGHETFRRCLHAYMDRWKGKHPGPYDFFYTFNDVSGQSLDWFWKPWFFDWGYPDLAISDVGKDDAEPHQNIVIERRGNLPVAVHVEIEYADGDRETVHRSPAVWNTLERTVVITGGKGKIVKRVKLGHPAIPDTNGKNNTWGQ